MSKITGLSFGKRQRDSFHIPFSEEPDVLMPSIREGSFEIGTQLEGNYFLSVHLSKAADSKLLFVFSLLPDVATQAIGDKIPLHTPIMLENLVKGFAVEHGRNYNQQMPEQFDLATASLNLQLQDHILNDLKASLLGVVDASNTPDAGDSFWACLAENFEGEFIKELDEALTRCVVIDDNNGGGTPAASRKFH